MLRLGLLGEEAVDLCVSEALLPQLVHKLLVLVLRLGKAACNKTLVMFFSSDYYSNFSIFQICRNAFSS